MTLLSSLLKPTPPDPKPATSPADIQRQINRLENHLAELERAAEDAALASYNAGEDPEAQRAEETAVEAVEAAKRRLATLGRALTAAKQAEADKLAEARAAILKSQRKACLGHLTELEGIAAEFADAQAKACSAYSRFLDKADKVRRAFPGGEFPMIPGFDVGSVKGYVSHELHRNGQFIQTDLANQRAFPGAKNSSTNTLHNPDGEKPFVDTVRESADHLRSLMRGMVV